METKICSKCLQEKTIIEFTFRTDTKKYRNQCKECISKVAKKRSKAFYEKNKDKIKQHRLDNIEIYKEKDKNYYLNNKENIKVKRKIYVENNKETINIKMKEYNLKNREELIKKKKKYYDDNRKKILNEKKEKYQQNKLDYQEKNRKSYIKFRDKRINEVKLYRKTPFGRLVERNKSHKRRTKLKEGDVSTIQLQHLIDNTNNCFWCNKKLVLDYHIDHFYPLSKGGEHTINNLVVSCSSCNLRKHSKDPYIFAKEIGKVL